MPQSPTRQHLKRHPSPLHKARNRAAEARQPPHPQCALGHQKTAVHQLVPHLFPSTVRVSKFDAVHRTSRQHPPLSYDNSGVGKKRIIHGREVSEGQVQAWADEAEAGYDVEELARRWGRPPRAEKASKVIPTRFSDDELASLMERAEREGIDRSTAIRAAVRQWAAA